MKVKNIITLEQYPNNYAGDWSNEKKAVIGILRPKRNNNTFIDGKRQKVPVANFLIKYVEPLASKNVVEIISAIKKYQCDASVINAFNNCFADLNIPINSRIGVDAAIKIISKSFHTTQQETASTKQDELFVKLKHNDAATETKLEYFIEIEKGNISDLILERWIKKENRAVAKLESLL